MQTFFLGTYTKRVSHGVYRFDFDPATGMAQNLQLVDKAGDPFYLTPGPSQTLLTIDRDLTQTTPGGLKLLDLTQPTTPILTNTYDSRASGTYVAYDQTRQLAFLANYDLNELSLYRVTTQSIQLLDRTANPGVNGPKVEQQDGPHPHFINYTPDHRLVVCDLGVDTVFTYDITDDFQLRLVAQLKLPAGFGPRHIRFNQQQPLAYVVGELSSEVATLQYDASSGQFSLQTITPTIPATWTAHNGAAAMRLSADKRFMYVSNRGYDSIAVFSLAADGQATLIQNIATGGDFPWDIQFTTDEQYLLIANQRSDTLSVFKRDADSGKLTLLNNDFYLPEPLAIVPDPTQTN